MNFDKESKSEEDFFWGSEGDGGGGEREIGDWEGGGGVF